MPDREFAACIDGVKASNGGNLVKAFADEEILAP